MAMLVTSLVKAEISKQILDGTDIHGVQRINPNGYKWSPDFSSRLTFVVLTEMSHQLLNQGTDTDDWLTFTELSLRHATSERSGLIRLNMLINSLYRHWSSRFDYYNVLLAGLPACTVTRSSTSGLQPAKNSSCHSNGWQEVATSMTPTYLNSLSGLWAFLSIIICKWMTTNTVTVRQEFFPHVVLWR